MFDNINDNFVQQPCSMAYTINGKQPVVCSYIHDEPLAYIYDDTITIEDIENQYDDIMRLLHSAINKMDELEYMLNSVLGE